MTKASTATHKCFALVLSGGGARGLSHAGVLRALIARGYIPSAVVGVSMGAVVGATYASVMGVVKSTIWFPSEYMDLTAVEA